METRRLDGNAAAGDLDELFTFDFTMARALCSGCGAMDPMGANVAYMDAPGLVMRCSHCDTVLLRAVRGPERWWVEMRGIVCLQIDQ